MGSFSLLRTAFSNIVTSLYPSDKQVFDTVDKISQAELAEDQDLFGYYTGFRIVPELRGSVDTTQDFGFYCGELASFDQSQSDRNELLDRMEAKAKAIIDAFIDSEQSNVMAVQSFSILPYYQGMNDTTSGVWCLVTVQISQSNFC